ncbi:MAG: hypothetical protein K2Y27_26855 [Xanthobacteraceae bacterium]|nr:hypothetical protein [Xanthobacteraceae bacterium]
MKALAKRAAILGVAGVLTFGSMTASEARDRAWIAGAAGFAVGAAIGAAAANASYYNAGYYNGDYYADEPAYAGPAYGYDSYAYSPTYVAPAVTYTEPAPVYAQQVQYRDPAFAYTGDPAYGPYRRAYRSYGYAPGYNAYAYAPGYRVYRGGAYDIRTRSVPPHYDPGAGYNSNTLAPWLDWKLQGYDY